MTHTLTSTRIAYTAHANEKPHKHIPHKGRQISDLCASPNRSCSHFEF